MKVKVLCNPYTYPSKEDGTPDLLAGERNRLKNGAIVEAMEDPSAPEGTVFIIKDEYGYCTRIKKSLIEIIKT